MNFFTHLYVLALNFWMRYRLIILMLIVFSTILFVLSKLKVRLTVWKILGILVLIILIFAILFLIALSQTKF